MSFPVGPNIQAPVHGPWYQNPGHDPDKLFRSVVIGAGANPWAPTIALEACAAGLSGCLVEGSDIASGPSSRHPSCLHGTDTCAILEAGLKTYLIWRQLQLWREALGERGHWLQAVPFLGPAPGSLLLPTRTRWPPPTTAPAWAVYETCWPAGGASAQPSAFSRQEREPPYAEWRLAIGGRRLTPMPASDTPPPQTC